MFRHTGQSRRRGTASGRRLSLASLIALAALWPLRLVEMRVGERFWLTGLLAYAPQHIFGIPALWLLIKALRRRQWGAALLNLLSLLIVGGVFLGIRCQRRRPAHAGRPFRVVTLNLHRLRKADAATIAQALAREQPDLICVQEARTQDGGGPSQEVLHAFADWYTFAYRDVALFSRFPILEQQTHPLPGCPRAMLQAVIDVRGTRVTVFGLHLAIEPKGVPPWLRPFSFPTYLNMLARIRALQIRRLLHAAGRCEGPVVILGDCNTPPQGISYRRITERYPDAFARAGAGAGFTFDTHFPMMRLDHVFTTPDVQVVRCRVGRERLSDHLPLYADLMLPR